MHIDMFDNACYLGNETDTNLLYSKTESSSSLLRLDQHTNIWLTGNVNALIISANTIRWINADLMLARRLRRRPNIKTVLIYSLVFAGLMLLPLKIQGNYRYIKYGSRT